MSTRRVVFHRRRLAGPQNLFSGEEGVKAGSGTKWGRHARPAAKLESVKPAIHAAGDGGFFATHSMIGGLHPIMTMRDAAEAIAESWL